MRFLRQGDANAAPDARTVVFKPAEMAEAQPIRLLPAESCTTTIEAGEQIEQTYRWTWADRFEWALCWVGPITAIVAALWLVAMVVAQVFR